ncbi:hypothetical protein K461DRAFT_263688 [Myriangium duriaei CBS 260.36]|uniref:Uncharacterized protein n=1 Tax=Myriangium duriaei CBS 260.36 TaxID=1168546 RepID=A0A9P4J7A1_9PEZI|nr:hypothetical protein K461DRAFT_263688 [Myriangium duriaei CBS 260.36]
MPAALSGRDLSERMSKRFVQYLRSSAETLDNMNFLCSRIAAIVQGHHHHCIPSVTALSVPRLLGWNSHEARVKLEHAETVVPSLSHPMQHSLPANSYIYTENTERSASPTVRRRTNAERVLSPNRLHYSGVRKSAAGVRGRREARICTRSHLTSEIRCATPTTDAPLPISYECDYGQDGIEDQHRHDSNLNIERIKQEPAFAPPSSSPSFVSAGGDLSPRSVAAGNTRDMSCSWLLCETFMPELGAEWLD